MIKEDRYLVLKRDEIDYFLSDDDKEQLYDIVKHLREMKKELEWPERHHVVVQDNWPEYETVWQMIEDRMDGQVQQPTKT